MRMIYLFREVDMLLSDKEYMSVVDNIKREIRSTQFNAILHVNSEMTILYYRIGQIINEHKVWGNKFIDSLAKDIRITFPQSTGFSIRNLKYMAKFAA